MMDAYDPYAPRLLTIPQVCTRLNVSRSALYRIVAAGSLRSIRIGRSVRIPVADIEAWEAGLLAEDV